MSNNSENILEQITRYLNGEMEEKEKKVFEKELDTDENLHQKFMQVVTHTFEKRRIENNIKDLQKKHPIKQTKVHILHSTWLKVAAVLLVLLIPAGILLNNYLKQDTLLNDHYLQYYSKNGHRSIPGQTEVDPKTKAFELYKTKQYDKAAPVFEHLAEAMDKPEEMYLYAAICNLRLGGEQKRDLSIHQLQKVLNSNNNHKEAATWFLAVAYFENGNKDQAEKLFEEIVSSDSHFNKQKAGEVLEKYY